LHLAANPNLYARDPREFDAVNHRGTITVLEAAKQQGVRRFVHVSTESILTSDAQRGAITETTEPDVSDVIGPYCRSKWEAERAARRYAAEGMPVTIASPTVPLGPGDRKRGPMSRLICQFAEGRIRGYLDGQINLIDVRDAAAGIWAVAERGRVGQRYLLSGETWSITQLFYALSAITNQRAPTWRVPYALALTFAWVEERYCRLTGRTPIATVTGVKLTRRSFRFDGSATAAELGLKRRPVMESLRDAVRYFQQTKVINLPEVAATPDTASS
jgi:dihydroflavonol-4-reductase